MTDASVSTLKGPSGPKPKRVFSSTNIIIYGTLLVVCLYYLLPLCDDRHIAKRHARNSDGQHL